MTENIRNLDTVKIDAATRAILLTKFKYYANFELTQRSMMEDAMRQRLAVKAPGEVPAGYTTVKQMENRDRVAEDAH